MGKNIWRNNHGRKKTVQKRSLCHLANVDDGVCEKCGNPCKSGTVLLAESSCCTATTVSIGGKKFCFACKKECKALAVSIF